MKKPRQRVRVANGAAGFTLIELAVVVAIIGLLLGGLLLPLATQVDARRVDETEARLEEAKAALYGFVISSDPSFSPVVTRLPCPDCMDNSSPGCALLAAADINDGEEDLNLPGSTCAAIEAGGAAVGNLPWVTLGIAQLDSWNRTLRYGVDPAFADGTADVLCGNNDRVSFGLCSQGAITVWDGAGGTEVSLNVPAVVLSMGDRANRMMCSDPADPSSHEDENADCDDFDFVSNTRSDDPGNEFDDLAIWISSTVLKTKVLEVNQLP